MRTRFVSPLTWPVYTFALAILLGTLLLWTPESVQPGVSVPFVDALFTATSAVCVTGLSTLNVGTTFNTFGQSVILLLVQLGGLGITTYSSLVFLLIRRRVPFTDRLAVSQALLSRSFDLASFLRAVVVITLAFELTGALTLSLVHPEAFPPFTALFHTVSAFCNAGFSLFPNNLESYSQDPTVNIVIMLLIVTGGLGFIVLDETCTWLRKGCKPRLSRYARTIWVSTLLLIILGALAIWLAEYRNPSSPSGEKLIFPALFQSISARTAGFNSVSLAALTSTSLLVLIGLMFVGGAPGSCAGGIKVTTFRVLIAFMRAQLTGRRQSIVNGRAASEETLRRALTLFFFAAMVISLSALLLSISEGSFTEHRNAPIPLLDILFESVSAFATAGLSTGITSGLNEFSKIVLVANMFMGRVGLFTLLLAMQSFRQDFPYACAETELPIG